MEYANQHQIIMELNEKNNVGEYPLYLAIYKNNIEIVNKICQSTSNYFGIE